MLMTTYSNLFSDTSKFRYKKREEWKVDEWTWSEMRWIYQARPILKIDSNEGYRRHWLHNCVNIIVNVHEFIIMYTNRKASEQSFPK